MSIVRRGTRAERRRLMAMARKSHEPDEVRRALAVLELMEGATVAEVARVLAAARSTVYRWVGWYTSSGVEALRSLRRGPRETTVTPALVEAVTSLLSDTPRAVGYLRSVWSSELLAEALRCRRGLDVHPSTLRRLLPKLGFGWRRARPTHARRGPIAPPPPTRTPRTDPPKLTHSHSRHNEPRTSVRADVHKQRTQTTSHQLKKACRVRRADQFHLECEPQLLNSDL